MLKVVMKNGQYNHEIVAGGKRKKSANSNINPELAEALGLDKDDKVKTISSEYHTLFVEELSESPGSIMIPFDVISELAPEGLPLDTEVIGEGISLDAPEIKFKRYTLMVGDFSQPHNTKENYYRILKEFEKAKPEDQLIIKVASNGGSIDEGLQLTKNIKANFTHDNITSVLDPHGFSMGSIMFLMGANRIVSEDSEIMLHNYSTVAFGKGGEIKDYIDFVDDKFRELARKRYVDTGYITEDEFQKFLIGKEWWFECNEMCRRGIATHFMTDDGEYITSEEYNAIREEAMNPKPVRKKRVSKKTVSKKTTSKKTTKELDADKKAKDKARGQKAAKTKADKKKKATK
jgi:ATP-dependent protease ClpP protease subunit